MANTVKLSGGAARIGGILIVAFAVLLVSSVWRNYFIAKEKSETAVALDAVVMHVETEEVIDAGDDEPRTAYHTDIKYTYNGTEYERHYEENLGAEGETYKIFINPNNPDEVILERSTKPFGALVLTTVFIPLTLIGIKLALPCSKAKKTTENAA